MSDLEVTKRKRGGARPGAGRPPKGLTKSDIQKAERLAKVFKEFTSVGLQKLAEKMPELYDTAIEEALGPTDENGDKLRPDKTMLKFLIGLGTNFVDLSELGQQKDGVASIIAGARNNPGAGPVTVNQTINHYDEPDRVPADPSGDGPIIEAEATIKS